MLLEELLLGHGQFHAEERVLERGLVQDVVGVELVAVHGEVEAEVAGPQAVERDFTAREPPKRLAGVGEVGRPDLADGLDRLELSQLVEPVQLAHALLRKGDLEHGGWKKGL